jgi:hypothetical protein
MHIIGTGSHAESTAISESEQHNRVALVSVDDQVIRWGFINWNAQQGDFAERQRILEQAQEVRRIVAQYTKPASTVQGMCDHPAKIIALQADNINLK